MVKRLATSPHDPLGITDSACKNQLVVVSVQYGHIYTYIPIRSTTIGKSRVAIDPIAMHTSWRSNSDIATKCAAPFLLKPHAAAAASLTGICSGQLDEENPSVLISSGLLVQADEGVSLPIVDLIDGGGIRIRHGSPTVVSCQCATCAHYRVQRVRTVSGQCAQRVRSTVRNMCARLALQARGSVRRLCGDPSTSSDTTVGAAADPDPAPGAQRKAPGSDQFHEEIGTSTVGDCWPPNSVHDWILDSFVGLH
ncbi:Dihydroflavonol-4-reductase [Dorcoceras hygrometricum]|uniref:Dihydroflavonol-4-reductase n=1 Tax=Dorcoceras hygrometricum TaxID=472368 RepID=A0A2Z7CPT5_9LAMI|nr:Dihydroflavonol-4-reductase [Dorcoceras hygrometricum]